MPVRSFASLLLVVALLATLGYLADATGTRDYCVVGVGGSGAIVCETLSRDKKNKVLCIEKGPDDSEFFKNLVGFYNQSRFIIDITGEPTVLDKFPWLNHLYSQESPLSLGGKSQYYAQAETLGGGLMVNGGVFNRPSRADLESWNSPYWTFDATMDSWKEVTSMPGGDPAFHGTGPLVYQTFQHDGISLMLQGAYATVLGQPLNPDTNGNFSFGVGLAGRNIAVDSETGLPVRQDSYNRVLKPILSQRSNLDLVYNAVALKIELANNGKHKLVYAVGDKIYKVKCKNEIVLSGGPLYTPQLLQLSGIGDCDALEALGIECKIANSHVGENLLTGTTYTQLWASPLSYDLFGGKSNGSIVVGYGKSFLYAGPPEGADIYIETTAFPTTAIPGLPTAIVASFGHRVANVGTVKLRKNNAFIDPLIKFNIYRTPSPGLLSLVDMFKKARAAMGLLAGSLFAFELQPSFGVLPANATDVAIATYLAQNLAVHHVFGGAVMHKVVDDRLRLIDELGDVVEGIRIVDTSIVPRYTMTYGAAGTAVLVGQHGANLILEDNA